MKAIYKPEQAHQRYVLKDGTEVKGASTIAKVDDEAFTIASKWGNKLGRQGIDCNTFRDQTAAIGNVAHFMVQCHFQRKIPCFKKMSQEAIEAGKEIFDRFMNWWVDEDLKWIASELQLLSEEFRYGGTLDIAACDYKDRIWLLDAKTSKGVFSGHKMQMAGLGQLWNENRDQKYHKLMIARVPRDKDCNVDPVQISNPQEVFDTFLAALNFINKKEKAGLYR